MAMVQRRQTREKVDHEKREYKEKYQEDLMARLTQRGHKEMMAKLEGMAKKSSFKEQQASTNRNGTKIKFAT